MRRIPLLFKEGWTRHKENAAKPPWMERTGWLSNLRLNHPVSASQRNGIFFLTAQPPLLGKEGNSPNLKQRQIQTESLPTPRIAQIKRIRSASSVKSAASLYVAIEGTSKNAKTRCVEFF